MALSRNLTFRQLGAHFVIFKSDKAVPRNNACSLRRLQKFRTELLFGQKTSPPPHTHQEKLCPSDHTYTRFANKIFRANTIVISLN